MVRPFRFGVSQSRAATGDEWREIARKAEDLGYDTFLAPDHLRGSLAPMVALASAADATKRIRIGTFVVNNDFRHPVLLAREAATLDLLSGGRFELGLGAGHSGDEYREAGIPFEEPPVRVAKLEEAVQVVKRMWAGGEASFAGEHYEVTGHVSHPPPTQGTIPLLIGGNGKDVLRLAAREADIVGFTGIFLAPDGRGNRFPNFSREGLANRIDIVREAAGDRFEALELNVLVQMVETEKPEERAKETAQELGWTVEDAVASPFTLFGSIDELEEKLLEQRATLGISYIATHYWGMEKMAPLVKRLSGK
jgi:probable F420-dependent oxidoreductase